MFFNADNSPLLFIHNNQQGFPARRATFWNWEINKLVFGMTVRTLDLWHGNLDQKANKMHKTILGLEALRLYHGLFAVFRKKKLFINFSEQVHVR